MLFTKEPKLETPFTLFVSNETDTPAFNSLSCTYSTYMSTLKDVYKNLGISPKEDSCIDYVDKVLGYVFSHFNSWHLPKNEDDFIAIQIKSKMNGKDDLRKGLNFDYDVKLACFPNAQDDILAPSFKLTFNKESSMKAFFPEWVKYHIEDGIWENFGNLTYIFPLSMLDEVFMILGGFTWDGTEIGVFFNNSRN